MHDAIPHPTSLPYPTFYTTFKATLYAARRTPTRRIRTSADVGRRLGLRYSPYHGPRDHQNGSWRKYASGTRVKVNA